MAGDAEVREQCNGNQSDTTFVQRRRTGRAAYRPRGRLEVLGRAGALPERLSDAARTGAQSCGVHVCQRGEGFVQSRAADPVCLFGGSADYCRARRVLRALSPERADFNAGGRFGSVRDCYPVARE